MNTNSNKSAFPIFTETGIHQDGLTKREYFAAMAMQGILAAPEECFINQWDYIGIAKCAVVAADALLKQLQNPKP